MSNFPDDEISDSLLTPHGAAMLLMRRSAYWDDQGRPSNELLVDYHFEVLDEEEAAEVKAYLPAHPEAQDRLLLITLGLPPNSEPPTPVSLLSQLLARLSIFALEPARLVGVEQEETLPAEVPAGLLAKHWLLDPQGDPDARRSPEEFLKTFLNLTNQVEIVRTSCGLSVEAVKVFQQPLHDARALIMTVLHSPAGTPVPSALPAFTLLAGAFPAMLSEALKKDDVSAKEKRRIINDLIDPFGELPEASHAQLLSVVWQKTFEELIRSSHNAEVEAAATR